MSKHLFAFLRQVFTFLCIDLSVTLALMLLFGVIALVLSTSGIYGVMSFAVTTDAGDRHSDGARSHGCPQSPISHLSLQMERMRNRNK